MPATVRERASSGSECRAQRGVTQCESRLCIEVRTLQRALAMHRCPIVASTLAVMLAGGCTRNLGSHATDGAADASDRADTMGANDAADAPACTGPAPQDCIVDECTTFPQFARVCQGGAWICPAPYQLLPPEPCCIRKVCLQPDGSLTNQVCSTGASYCQTGIEVPPGGDASADICPTATTEAACTAMRGCHAVYTAEPRTPVGSCTCPDFGCCSLFAFCAYGSKAPCAGSVSCSSAAPYCEPTYSVANDGSCYVGCVKSSACSS
jgi:hypothetical protein